MRDLAGKFARYFVTGGLAAIVDLGGFAALIAWRLPPAPAATLSFLAASIVNYLATTRFVFGRAASARGYLLFLSAALVGLAINVSVTVAGTSFFHLAPVLAKLCGIAVAFLANFAINVRFVFRTR